MAPSDGLPVSTGEATYLIHHVVLPPQLPQKDDYTSAHERCLIDTAIYALQDLRDHVKEQDIQAIVTSAVTAMANLRDSQDEDGNVSELQLQEVLLQLATGTRDEQVPLEIKAQNAGLLISRRGELVVFESFELSPTNNAAMSTVGRLVRTFPGSASRVQVSIMQDKDFRESLAYTIAKMTTQTAPGMQPQVRKMGQNIDEDRDTTDPAMVSDWLMNYIAALGGFTDTVSITKNTRDEVLWRNCRHPWRRSPLWLLIRVTLQLLFTRASSNTRPLHGLYKVFMAQLLLRILKSAKAKWTVIGSETLYVVYAKLERRIRKLENLGHLNLVLPSWAKELKASMVDTHAFIDKKWNTLTSCQRGNIDTTVLRSLQPEKDLDTTLPKLDAFLASISTRRQDTACANFQPDEQFPAYPEQDLPKTLGCSGDTKYLRLAAVEAWIERYLQSWVSCHLRDRDSCGKLYALMQLYHAAASAEYSGIPASLSTMYLTLLELWVACDKSACVLYPLLSDFDPELALDELQCLVLPLHSQMQRLAEVERYVGSRRKMAIEGSPSVFSHFGKSSTFAVRYFNQSQELQTALATIERDAEIEQKSKCKELANLKLQYESLMQNYNRNVCETETYVYNRRHRYTATRHSSTCRRCDYKTRAERMSIHIYEWPLSSDIPTAKATVFELKVPQAYSEWRDASMFLVATALGFATRDTSKPTTAYTLDQHHGLSNMLQQQDYRARRIVPLSTVKPHTRTHRKTVKVIPTLENDNVCLPNALRYVYHDKSLNHHTGDRHSTEHVAKKCVYQMPDARSRNLESFLYRPPSCPDGRTPNEVIASLSDCPVHFSIDEYKSFGALPSGRNIIYSNILTQLATPTIDFAKVETQTLLLQAVGQCGLPNGLSSRTSHSILLEDSFCHAMLAQLELSLLRISENWESWRAVATFVGLSLRILSMTPSVDVQDRSLEFLAKARKVSMEWLIRLQGRARDSVEEKQRSDLYSRATEIALLCTQTFSVEDKFIDVVLKQPSATSILLRCSIVVQENGKLAQSESQAVYKAMLQSWRTTLYCAFTKLRQCIQNGDTGLDTAVRKNWADFDPLPGAHWKTMSEVTHKHWLCTKSGDLTVFFNLLTAELLVNGLPLARLPSEFVQHPIYMPLFGKSTLEVVPTDQPGMRFSAKSTYQGYKLHFGMSHTDMLLVAVKNNSKSDLIPSRLFQDCLPLAFVTKYIHWYDHDQDEVIFCSRDDPWSNCGPGWRLIRKGVAWRLVKDACILANIYSNTASTLSKIFGTLEHSQHVHTVLDTLTHTVHINLPRLQLDFHVASQETTIHSRQYRGMIVDPDQTMGTLIGLASKLVLKPATTIEDRLVLIPVPRTFDADSISCITAPKDHHVLVCIKQDKAQAVYAYSLDTTLGRVQESGDVQRRLFLALLHALTSHCLPDPLTGYTGTESALTVLQSAAVRSFEFLTTENVELLYQIAKISPSRSFYPPEIMDMQTIEWDARLPFLSQHPKLRVGAEDIIRQAETHRLYYPDQMPDTTKWTRTNSHLELRDCMRTSTFRVYGFGADMRTSGKDKVHEARDVSKQSQRGQRAYMAATMIARDEAVLDTTIRNLSDILLQTHFKGENIDGPSNLFDPKTLHYDSKWLGDATEKLRKFWCSLHLVLPKLRGNCNRYNIMTWLSTMAFAKSSDVRVIQVFAIFYRLQSMPSVTPPSVPAFHLADGSSWKSVEIFNIVRNSAKSFDDSEEENIPKQYSETDQEHDKRINSLFKTRQDAAVQFFVAELERQWPVKVPVRPTHESVLQYVDVSGAMSRIEAKFKTWYHNSQFLRYLQGTSALMAQQQALPITSPHPNYSKPLVLRKTSNTQSIFHIDCIFAAAPPTISREERNQSSFSTLVPPCEPVLPTLDRHTLSQSDGQGTGLKQLCETLQSLAKSKCEMDYVDALRDSCASLKALHVPDSRAADAWSDDTVEKLLQTYLDNCKRYFKAFNLALYQVVAIDDSLSNHIGLLVQHSPRTPPTFWLAQLHRDRFGTLSDSWKTVIIEYGLAVTQLHRAQRLVSLSHKPADLMEELGHIGHSNWDPQKFPETLLLEAESGILIRKEQEYIASHMRDSQDATNIVLQLLMGGGKSSTIVPMLAAYLADRKQLVRIIVAKPQSKQMLHMLISKLGYLLNRRIYHMPFSRSLRPNVTEANLIRQTYEECIVNRGVLLIQPEHILSFKLMAIEALLAGQACAGSLLETQKFFDNVSRDIVDESDENFSVKFELIYTMGTQRSIEFAPERWQVIQAIVGLIPRFAKELKKWRPESIEVERDEAGRFPRVRILRSDTAGQLLLLLAKHIVEFGIVGLPTSSQSPDVQASLLRYITNSELTASEIAAVESSRFWTESTKHPLLLVRGLIAGGILQFALGTKRWRVNYGLDPSRIPETQLAVPFRSKDCPSPRSEFSHPDVVILLSLLSHYYGGLTDEQLFDSFVHLLKSDQGNIQYDEWVATASPDLPPAFRQLSGVSIKDPHQCIVELFPFLRYSKKAIDYYLSFLVFPKAMKEFPQKLSASGWDIGAVKTHPVTGFSGTNDTLHLLPLTVKHLDLPSQSHTNALVLRYLLQAETSVELLPPRTNVNGSDADHLLSLVVQMVPEVRVILDCGASILEQDNQQVAEAWLKMLDDDSIEAVVFFEDEELSVLDRAGRIEPLQTSPFAKNLGVCLVYLDEAHTRGTDLKLPRDYRAAVTLGQGLVKDKLTQGCMRMRKLGLGQSVAFIVPEEISAKICERTGKLSNDSIEVSDILCWSITETWQDLKRSMPLWAVQGERYERNSNSLHGVATTQAQAQSFLEDEAQTLEARYKPLTKEEDSLGMLKTWDLGNVNIVRIVARCREFDAMGFGIATLSEEQERELAPEIEEERQIERPARLEPEGHSVHSDVRHLVQTGYLRPNPRVFKPAFHALATTSAARLFALGQFPTDLMVTADFERTVKVPNSFASHHFISDSYQRPVQFVLSVRDTVTNAIQQLVIISPVEANSLLSFIREHAKVTLHIFAPRANASFESLDKLELYNIGHAFMPEEVSRSLTVQLNLFTGSLYLRSFEEYTELCDFLGLLRCKPVKGQQVYADGFIDPPSGHWGLRMSPVPFLRTLLMKIRREGEGVEKTHLGRILNGVRLEEADFVKDVEMSGT
ncbi:hypothetical protein HBI55_034300 [Parastagonospora nodorum]|nr:hypothetical protein HBI55_034300 [Parastagonospora nodorum]